MNTFFTAKYYANVFKLAIIHIVTFSISLYCVGQTRTIERLKDNIRIATNSNQKLAALLTLCDLGYTLNPDTLFTYATQAKKLAANNHDLHTEVQTMFYQSGALTTKGLIDSSLNVANKCLEILDKNKIDDLGLRANIFNQKGRCFMRKNKTIPANQPLFDI